MTDPLSQISTTWTPQTSPIPGSNQVANNAGGYSFQLDDWSFLERFLILGTWGGTYYAKEQKLTQQNSDNVINLAKVDGVRVVDIVLDVSLNGRAYRQNPTIFSLATVVAFGSPQARAYALNKVSDICRTGTMLYQFVQYCENLGSGWGRAMKRSIGEWYTDRTPNSLATQLVKYRQRDGWSHRDLLRLAKPKITADSPLLSSIRWTVGKDTEVASLPDLIKGFIAAQKIDTVNDWVNLINEYKLPWEALPTQALNNPEVWEAMVPTLGATALLRNLGKMGSVGMAPNSSLAKAVKSALDLSVDQLRSARVHPMQVLLAMTTYQSGKGVKGSNTWTTVPSVINQLDDLFYKSFGTLETTNKRRLLALDVSGSMGSPLMNTNLTCRDATAALALIALNQDPDSYTFAFSRGFTQLNFSSKMRLTEAINTVSNFPFQGTDCSLPMEWAIKNNIQVDTFEVYTDSETYAGRRHPMQALNDYRQRTGIPAKLVVNGMTSTEFTIADPADGGSIDVVGFDSNTPKVISDFIK